MVDIYKIRPGDEVTVRGTVHLTNIHRATGKSVVLTIAAPEGGSFASFEAEVGIAAIVEHLAPPLAAGDFVWGCATKTNGKVIATHENLAWVEFEDGRHEVVLPDQVERAS